MQTHYSKLSLVFVLIAFPVLSFGQNNSEEEARTYMVRGVTAIEMAKSPEELAAAVDEFKKAIEIDPTLAAAWYNLGSVQTKLGQFKNAIDSYNNYLKLAPQADDARKVKDDVIKLNYRLEQAEKFNFLSGMWITPDGAGARITAENGILQIRMERMDFTGSVALWMYDDLITNRPNIYESAQDFPIRLEVRGNKLVGSMEIPRGSASSDWCALPTEKGSVEGTLDKGQIQLKIQKTTFKVVMNGNDSLFASPKLHCDEVTPTGDMTQNVTLIGPLGKGGLKVSASSSENGTVIVRTSKDSAAGLEDNDEIVSVDGADLAQLKTYGERIMKLRGQPGSELHLVVKRVTEKGGVFSKEKKAMSNISVRLVDID